jgi:predicted enzyme involved in methoxymalonyl-ACP biosynthesis
VEIEQRLRQDSRNVVAVRLSDRLSDSGVVAALVGQLEGVVLRIEELSISCRALGRRLEDTLITRALTSMAEGRAVKQVRFDVASGPRNTPARDWLAAYAPGNASYDGPAVIVPIGDIHRRRISDAVTIVAPVFTPIVSTSGEVIA